MKRVGSWWWFVLTCLVLAGACGVRQERESGESSRDELSHSEVQRSRQALTTEPRILGFEQTADWTPANLRLALGDVHVEGAHSAKLAVLASGATLTSAAMSSLGQVSSTWRLQVWLPSYLAGQAFQGQFSLRINSQAAGVFTQVVGPVQFKNAPVGVFREVAFSIPSAVVTALSTKSYNDLRLTLQFDVSPNPSPNPQDPFSDPLYVDRLDVGLASVSSGSGGTSGSGGASVAGGGTGTPGGGASGGQLSSGGGSTPRGGSGGSGATLSQGGASGGSGGGTAGTTGAQAGSGSAGAGSGGTSGAWGTGGLTSGPCVLTPASAGSTATTEFFIELPHESKVREVALGAYGGALRLENNVRVIEDTTGFAAITSVRASERMSLGLTTELGNAFAEERGIDLHRDARVRGFLKTANVVTTPDGPWPANTPLAEQGVFENENLKPLERVAFKVQFPAAHLGSCTLNSAVTQTLAPGSYGDISVQPRSRLKLFSGRYVFRSFNVERDAVLELDNGNGPVHMFVRGRFGFGGTIQFADATRVNLLLGVADPADLNIQNAFRGVLVAPWAKVTLPSVGHNPGHVGSFFAKSLVVSPSTTVRHHPFEPSEVCEPGGACSSLCPCGPGGQCTQKNECQAELECNNGQCGCVPNCAGKKCGDDLSDGCGNQCPSPCSVGDTGCRDDRDCGAGALCAGRSPESLVPNMCVPVGCFPSPEALGCGSDDSPCGPTCTSKPVCGPGGECPTGSFCGDNNGWRYGKPGKNVCEEVACLDPATAKECGTVFSRCGLCSCTGDCSGRACGDETLDNGCGELCTNLCTDGDPRGCRSDADCPVGSQCAENARYRKGVSTAANVCLPGACFDPARAEGLCGSPDDPCGRCPIDSGNCAGRECGLDPATGQSCGESCPSGSDCSPSGLCVPQAAGPNPIRVPDADGGTRPVIVPASPPPPGTGAKGFGAMGGQFSVSDHGSATYTIPIAVPPGRQGLSPELAIKYSSSTGNGVLGVGFSLEGLSSIRVCQRTYAQDGFTMAAGAEDQVAYCLDGQRLVLVGYNEYRTEVETFAKVLFVPTEGPGYFQVFTKDGRVLYYGYDPESNGVNALGEMFNGLPRTYALSRIEDRNGNFMRIRYRSSHWGSVITDSTTELLPDSITYTGHGSVEGDRSVKFVYDNYRPDQLHGYHVGGGTRLLWRRLRQILISLRDQPVHSYEFGYEEIELRASRVNRIQECVAPGDRCKAPTLFRYYTEYGFGSPEELTVESDHNQSSIPRHFVPFGMSLQQRGPDALGVSAVTPVTSVSTPFPGGASLAAASIPMIGPFLSQGMIVANIFGARQDTDLEFRTLVYRFGGPLITYTQIPSCPAYEQPTLHVIRRLSGEDQIHSFCTETISRPGWTLKQPQRLWFPDLDGDGIQDKLFCDYGNDRLDYKLGSQAPRAEPPLDAVHETRDGQVPAISSLCRLDCEASPEPPLDDGFGLGGLGLGGVGLGGVGLGANVPKPCLPYPPATLLFDVDGDGTNNLVVVDPKAGFQALFFRGKDSYWRTISEPFAPDLSRYWLAILDANGDGLRDVLALPSRDYALNGWGYLWENDGQRLRSRLVQAGTAQASKFPAYVMDVDHDGKDEIIHPDDQQADDSNTPRPWRLRRIALNDSEGGLRLTAETLAGPEWPGTVGDFNGDGNPDALVRAPNSGIYLLHPGLGSRQHLLASVVDGLGRQVEVDYERKNPDGEWTYRSDVGPGRWPTAILPKSSRSLVSAHRESHYLDGARTQRKLDRQLSYTYSGELADTAGLGSLGLSSRTIAVKDAAGATVKKTQIRYVAPISNETEAPLKAPYVRTRTGLVAEVIEDFAHADSRLNRMGPMATEIFTRTCVLFDWQERRSRSGRPFAILNSKTSEEWDVSPNGLTEPQLLSRTEEASSIDEDGNLTNRVTRAADMVKQGLEWKPAPGSETVTVLTQTFDPTPQELESWLISLRKAVDIEERPRCPSGNDCEAQTRRRHSTFDYYPSGQLRNIAREPGQPQLELTTEIIRDGLGNVEQSIETNASHENRTVTFGFDDARIFPVTITNALDQTTQVRFDERFGLLSSRADPNGIDETWSYDDFGVLRHYLGPSGEQQHDYEPAGSRQSAFGSDLPAAYSTTSQSAGGASVTQYFDAIGNVVQRVSRGLNGAEVIEDFVYDARNRLSSVTRPHLPSDTSQGVVEYRYDALNRLVEELRPNGAVARTDYSSVTSADVPREWLLPGAASFVRTVEPRLDSAEANSTPERSTTRLLDRDGRERAIVDAAGRLTRYERDAFGRVSTIQGPDGHILRYEFDAYGRPLSTTDPATGGTHRAEYDGFGDLRRAWDPLNRLTSSFYDSLGRLTRTEDSDGTTQWIYDGEGPNEVGKLVETISPSNQRVVYGYEPRDGKRNRGLLATVTQHLLQPDVATSSTGAAGVTLTTRLHHDEAGRLEQIEYPEGAGMALSVRYEYDDFGNVVRVSDPENSDRFYWRLVDSDQGYRIKTEQFGSLVTTSRTLDPQTGELTETLTQKDGRSVQKLSYSWDAAGRMQTRQDHLTSTSGGVLERFVYDALGRLEDVLQDGRVAVHYEYDPKGGGLSFRTGMGKYTYQAEGRDWVQSAGEHAYDHDDLGNVRLRSGPTVPGGRQSIDYNRMNLPVRVETGDGAGLRATVLTYDASGSRVAKQTGDSVKYYSNDLYEETREETTTTHRYLIYAAGRPVAALTRDEHAGVSDQSSLTFLHDDVLGSVQTITNSSGELLQAQSFEPFGSGRQSSSTLSRGFTGHEHDDELGLINMRGRMYDPHLGQFLSADPVIQEPTGQGLNRFAYVFNSPLNYVDPSGFRAKRNEIASGATGAFVAAGWGTAAGILLAPAIEWAASGLATFSVVRSGPSAGASLALPGTSVLQAINTGAAIGLAISETIALTANNPVYHPTQSAPTARGTVSSNNGTPPPGRTAPEAWAMTTEGSSEIASVRVANDHDPVYCGPEGPTCAPSPAVLSALDVAAREFVERYRWIVDEKVTEYGTSFELRGGQWKTTEKSLGVSVGHLDGDRLPVLDIKHHRHWVKAIIHMHPYHNPNSTFSTLDIEQARTLGVPSYISTNRGQYLLRFDPKENTITCLPGLWGQSPSGGFP